MSAAARNRLEETELALMELNDRRRALRSRAADDPANRNNTEEELDRMDRQAGTLACQALACRDEMEGCEFVSDERGIRRNLAQLGTYLDPAELISLLIRKVAISRDHAVVNYKSPMPKDRCPEGVTYERIPLD